jgi:hypothetical protein
MSKNNLRAVNALTGLRRALQNAGSGIRVAAIASGLAGIATALAADTRTCTGSDVTVTYEQDADAALVCDAAHTAVQLFESCNIPPLNRTIRIALNDNLRPGCAGLYHCGEDFIEVAPPAVIQSRREGQDAFGALDRDAYFQSVVVHELAHAASDGMPCGVGDCVVGAEYIAYAVQVMSLDAQARMAFAQTAPMGKPVPIDTLNPFLLLIAPGQFAQTVWAHFSQQDDGCGVLGRIIEGKMVLDHEIYQE